MKSTLTLTFPEIFSISPRIQDNRDDLPQPTVPTTATREPSSTLTFILKKENNKYY